MNTLDIVITHYNEPIEVCRPLLESIALQQCVDFSKVGIIFFQDGENDHSDVPKALAEDYARKGINIRALECPHGGVSVARNHGLKYAYNDAEYVMFCDCDDMFLSALGLYIIFKEIDEGSFDVLSSLFLEEGRDNFGQPVYIPHEHDSCFIHGKVYSVRWLIQSGLCFNPDVRVHEDGCFNAVAMNVANEKRYVDKAFYLWKWRDDSIVRNSPLFVLRTYDELVKARCIIVDELLNRDNKMQACYYAGMLLFDAYYLYNICPKTKEADEPLLLECAMRCFAFFYSRYKYLIDLLTPSSLSAISRVARMQAIEEGLTMERITFGDWIAYIKSLMA